MCIPCYDSPGLKSKGGSLEISLLLLSSIDCPMLAVETSMEGNIKGGGRGDSAAASEFSLVGVEVSGSLSERKE